MENFLPPIKEMYNCERNGHDYSVNKKYHASSKLAETKRSITKKGHYLDDSIRMSTSPGPASICFSI
jgi:hypothetical protein